MVGNPFGVQVNETTMKYLDATINQPSKCGKETLFLMAVISSPINFQQRKSIRKLWRRPTQVFGSGGTLLFFLGKTTSTKVQFRIEKESAKNKDIVQFDIMDDYTKLTTKSINMMHWFTVYCRDARWYVKSADDVFWNIPVLNSLLSAGNQHRLVEKLSKSNFKLFEKKVHYCNHYLVENPYERSPEIKSERRASDHGNQSLINNNAEIICAKTQGTRVCRYEDRDSCDPRSVMTKYEYPYDEYPRHCRGSGYVLRSHVVEELVKKDALIRTSRRLRMEDVYVTGILTQGAGFIELDMANLTTTTRSCRHDGRRPTRASRTVVRRK
ncbi:beta-1,3-galactosyltransferase 1-like [Hyalella azteca]|uniref:Hexosyltransferase n=1 Tax=Hyalella azteca TaxID=294128 RepID=A0A979FMZ2_HYAAZ|nr:beta-1,3-galactosyltransferase 1-like [Hyalella azteca]